MEKKKSPQQLWNERNRERTRLYCVRTRQKKKGVIAASAGNHSQGVALAAKKLGIKATVYMPIGASLPKVEATRNYGARVVQQGGTFAECLKAAQEEAKNTGAIFIPPFDHIDVVLGQGTVGLEILQQHPDVSTIVVAIGGGEIGRAHV
jgi:threonine dehydratase